LRVAVLIIGLAVLAVDDLLHAIDLLSHQLILQLQKLLILRLVILEDVGDGFSVLVEHPEGLVDGDGEGAVRSVDYV
jgi:hypothetical protein